MDIQIHKTAIVSDEAKIADNVKIGPYCTVGPQVTIGSGTVLESHVVLDGDTSIGVNNYIYSFVSIGKAITLTKHILGQRGFENLPSDDTFRRYANWYKKANYDTKNRYKAIHR